MHNGKKTYLVVTAVAGAGLATVAFATPSSGILGAPVFARASFVSPVDFKFKVKDGSQAVIEVDNTRETVVQQIVISPGGQTGWHSHPGPVIVLIKAGTMTFYDGDDPTCAAHTFTAGQSFIDNFEHHVHTARNESASENLELWAVYMDVPPGGAFRLDAAAPGNCAF
jgi:quercetin dioxygenase-like cupin family protein